MIKYQTLPRISIFELRSNLNLLLLENRHLWHETERFRITLIRFFMYLSTNINMDIYIHIYIYYHEFTGTNLDIVLLLYV